MELEINEFSRCLQIPPNTIERWIRQGRMPVKKVGTRCFFSETALKKWARSHNLPFYPPGQHPAEKREETLETLHDVVERGGIYYGLGGRTVEEVLGEAVSVMQNIGSEDDRRLLYESLVAREQMMSTGIGNGVAIPHPRTPLSRTAIPTQIAACFLQQPVDFKAVDKKAVHVLFVLVAASARQHLHLLSRLSFCLRDASFIELLSKTPGPEILRKKIAEFDARLNGGA